ncbi:transcription factor MYB120-like [Lates japonicus]
MFINTGGLPVSQQHNLHGDKLHLHPQRHHHGHRNLQQFNQLHLPHWSGRLAASRHVLFPGPRRHGSLSPAALLLKLPQPTLTSFFSASAPPLLLLLLLLLNPPTPSSHPVQPRPSLTETTRLTRMDSTTFFVLLK